MRLPDLWAATMKLGMRKMARVYSQLTIAKVVFLKATMFAASTTLAFSQTANPIGTAEFTPINIGAGGFVTNINIVGDGTKVARTDTFGAWVCYRCSNTFGLWSQLVSHSSMPPADSAAMFGQNPSSTGCCGVYEIVIAPSNSSVAYMYFNGYIFVTTNLDTCATAQCPGLKWTRT